MDSVVRQPEIPIMTPLEFFRRMDTSPLAMALFGRPVERVLASRCSAALAERLEGADGPLSLPARDETPSPSLGRFNRKTLRSFGRRTLKAVAYVHVWYILVVALLLGIYRHVDPPVTILMTYRSVVDGWELSPHRSVPLSKIPRLARRMVVSVEDGKFYQHGGIDFDAVRYAMQVNKQVGRPLYGGSTLSMQTARTLFLIPFKSYLRKYLEVIATLEMELILSKDRILEIYLSWAEWGKGVFGLEAASRNYYGKSAARLDVEQTARLVALLSSPIRYTPKTLQKNGILRSRYQYLMRKYGSS
jgi:monofunctional biosynthetic peptidoglycan transglycosylase